jgi:hypothetical protein
MKIGDVGQLPQRPPTRLEQVGLRQSSLESAPASRAGNGSQCD